MKAKITLWYNNHRNGINTTKFTFLSFVLLVVVWIVDIQYPDLNKAMPEFFLLTKDVSKSFLSNLSGVFLTVTTFTLTTILTVLTTYASNFTPRVVQKFIDKPHVLSLIGVFVGGFFYTVLSLLIIQDVAEDQKLLAGSLGIIYAILSMVYFMKFVHKVLYSIKGVNVIQDVYEEAEKLIQEESDLRKKSTRYLEDEIQSGFPIYSLETGYFYDLNEDELLKILIKYPCELVTKVKIGEYVLKDMEIAEIHSKRGTGLPQGQDQEDWLDAIAKTFLLNPAKNDQADYHHEMTNLVEIALRAISPGINDPNTAINCIGKICNLLGQLFSTKNNFILLKNQDDSNVVYVAYSVEEELYLTFYQLIHYGKEDPSIAKAILEGILHMYLNANDEVKASIASYYHDCYQVFYDSLTNKRDREKIQDLYQNFKKQEERNSRNSPS